MFFMRNGVPSPENAAMMDEIGLHRKARGGSAKAPNSG
jgi:hypothetical protein